MAVVDVEIQGTRHLRRRLRQLKDAVAGRAVMGAAMKAAGEVVRDEAERLAPRRTGRLKENIINVVETGQFGAEARIGPERRAWYGIFPELGTVQHPAHPYLRPAIDTKRGEAIRELNNQLRANILRELGL